MRFKIPASFMLMARTITVSLHDGLRSDDEQNEEVQGLGNWEKGFIKLDRNQEPTALMHTFFHEVTHLVFEASGREDLSINEALVDLVGGMWHQAIVSAK
jgi:hypothetical protein